MSRLSTILQPRPTVLGLQLLAAASVNGCLVSPGSQPSPLATLMRIATSITHTELHTPFQFCLFMGSTTDDPINGRTTRGLSASHGLCLVDHATGDGRQLGERRTQILSSRFASIGCRPTLWLARAAMPTSSLSDYFFSHTSSGLSFCLFSLLFGSL